MVNPDNPQETRGTEDRGAVELAKAKQVIKEVFDTSTESKGIINASNLTWDPEQESLSIRLEIYLPKNEVGSQESDNKLKVVSSTADQLRSLGYEASLPYKDLDGGQESGYVLYDFTKGVVLENLREEAEKIKVIH